MPRLICVLDGLVVIADKLARKGEINAIQDTLLLNIL